MYNNDTLSNPYKLTINNDFLVMGNMNIINDNDINLLNLTIE